MLSSKVHCSFDRFRRIFIQTYGLVQIGLIVAFFLLFFYPSNAFAAGLPVTGTFTKLAEVASPLNVSSNWAGYTVAGKNTYTGVGATWTIQNASSTGYSADSTWVGIGGVSGEKNLIQIGTLSVSKTNDKKGRGIFTYQAWYELLPALPVNIPVTIKPGDSITASIKKQSTNYWLISFNNITTGQSYETSVYYVSDMSSAEWIEEMPQMGSLGIFAPLANFGLISLTDAWVIKNDIKQNMRQSGAKSINMLGKGNQSLAVTSPLGLDGSSFNVSRVLTSETSTALALRK